ncbi:MAG TPA: VOC family protein [Candidatus Binatia bacterium]|jgi:catechol 2,3-dioxygenase-like lactoylglutathione lyase family enzyme
MPRIRHIALLTNDPPKLAEFYRNSFGMKEVARSGEKQDAIYLSDGHINLAILPARGRPEGIFHFGFEVTNVEKATHDAIEAGATKGADSLPRDGRFAEGFIRDPVGTRVDLSLGWKI